MRASFAVCTGKVCTPPPPPSDSWFEGGREILRYLRYIVMWCCEGRMFLQFSVEFPRED